MNTDVIIAIIGFIQAVVVAILGFYTSSQLKKQEQSNKQLEKLTLRRQEESKLALKMQEANNQLTVGIAYAIKHGHCNGEVEDGLKAMENARKDYVKFLEEIALEEIKQ